MGKSGTAEIGVQDFSTSMSMYINLRLRSAREDSAPEPYARSGEVKKECYTNAKDTEAP